MTKRHTLLALVLLAVAFSGAGCNFSHNDKVIVVTATPNHLLVPPTGEPTVPYVTPTPHTVPTPTTPPREAVEDAKAALRNGDYETAVTMYEGVLADDTAEDALRSSAAYGLGEAALREGLYQRATLALTKFIREFPDDPRIPHAYFLRGDAYQGIGEWQFSIDDFNTYLGLRPGVIDSYAYERIGDAYLALEQPEQALTTYAKAAEATRALAPLMALRERVAASYLNAGQPTLAVQQYDAILAEANNAAYRASIELQAAQVELANGDIGGAHQRLQRIVRDYPDTYSAYGALQALLDAGLAIDSLQQGRIYFANEDYQAAIQAFNDYTSETGVAPADVLLMLGQAYRAVGNPQAALTTFQTVIDYYPDDTAFGDAWLEQGRTLFQSGDTAGAIQKYSALATQHPDVTQGAEALWRAGYLYGQQGNVDSALATFDILGQMFPGTEWAQDGLIMGATLATGQGDTASASQMYSQLAATATGENQAMGYLWVGRLYQQDGKDDLARQAYQAAAAADPGGYYSVRAEDLLAGREPFAPPADFTLTFDEGTELAAAEDWLRSTFSITQEGTLYTLSDTLKADPRMIRGQELLAVTAYSDAEEELSALREEYNDDPLALYQLAIFFRDENLYRLSIEAAARLITLAEVDTLSVPSAIARLRYPVYYSDLVLPATQEYNLDPLLVFALIRQESLFEGFATSYAAAQGLMQIIPDTGEWIALQLGWPDYQNSDVYRPYINVHFGAYYLSFVLDLVDNEPYAALAGYNGGPSNAVNWLGISGPDLDLFVQTIEYDETQAYVRRIYENYSIYRALYGAGDATQPSG
ncbi:tetratricopeptide repeat protein [Aggregatilinea lenta]|uniref:tetratricopeptide repeat protein n=1 Tax=Aggregatilinea lenta TaxID=913108 RepID=UPI000E5C504D|nr:tetratricopeptide repeat protein [Aggregatilinea lenta]